MSTIERRISGEPSAVSRGGFGIRRRNRLEQQHLPAPPFLPDQNGVPRRTILAAAGLGVASAAVAGLLNEGYFAMQRIPTPSHEVISSPRTHADRAHNGLMNFSMERGLFSKDPHKGWDGATFKSWEADAWPFGPAYHSLITYKQLVDRRQGVLESTLAVAEKNLQRTSDGAEEYWDTKNQPAGYLPVPRPATLKDRLKTFFQSDELFIDDSAWIANANTRVAKGRTTEQAQKGFYQLGVVRAQQVFQLGLENQNKEGGVNWKREPEKGINGQTVVSNAPLVQLALRLGELSGDNIEKQVYFTEATKIYNWVRNTLLDGDDLLYLDNISNEGVKDTRKLSYCQGTMIGAGALLYEASGLDSKYLAQAEETAISSLSFYTRPTIDLLREPLEFVEIYFRNLLYLSSLTQNNELAEKIEKTVANFALRLLSDQKIYNQETGSGNFSKRGGSAIGLQAASLSIFSMKELTEIPGTRDRKYAGLI